MTTEIKVGWYMKWLTSDIERSSGFVNDMVKQ